EAAMEALWDAILKVTRVYGNPIKNWVEHNKNLSVKTAKLNDLKIKTLTYKSKNGTDFTVDIHPDMNFLAGGETTLSGVFYNPNMPTEECFTSPVKTSANGVVMATKPLSVQGVLVDNFGFRFKDGKVVEVICKNEKYKDVLEKLISTDEGASMLGEVALVPFDSPINQTNLLFYNTLYDENACCHLALGRAFTECIKDYQRKSKEELDAVDLNNSIIHEDFMIGSSDLSIIADTYDGKKVQIFKDGTWAI
ncbi:MAG: aminopeptidase, partial [Anaeroplasmataceae bacterium]|nr:aminopeptidase [Anaeroplasmataceae bacterium]